MANAPNPSAGAAKAAQPQPQPSLSPYTIHQLYQSQSSNPSILYPVASSGRGFNPRPVLRGGGGGGGGVALSGSNNSNNSLAPSPSYSYRPVAAASAVSSVSTTATIDSHMHPHLLPALHPMRQHPSHHYPPLLPSVPNPIKGFPVTAQPLHKVTPSPVSDSNGYKSARSRDDTLVVRNRKVRISDGATLYSLCRSWLRNGFPEETQPQHGDAVRSLPRPLPIPAVDNHSAKEEGEEEEEKESMEEDEDEEPVEDLSTEDLLKRHIEHAKRVRARLREERLKRIARYKTRLALLLPTQTEQIRNDAAGGN